MAVHEIIPTENLSIQDIIDTVVANGGQLAEGLSSWHDVRSLFTEAANINLASKRKPIIRAVNFCQDFDSSKPNYLKDWWKNTDGWCGISPLRLGTFKNIPQYFDGKNNGWQYHLPRGGSSAPMRLGDFAGYYPKARLFISDMTLPEKIYKKDTDSFLISFVAAKGNDLQLGIEDLPFSNTPEYGSLAGRYVGVVVADANGDVIGAQTAQVLNETSFRMETQHLPVGEVTFYPFISELPLTLSPNEAVVADAYTIPQAQPLMMIVIEGSITIILTATFMSRYTLSWNAIVDNDLSEQRVMTAGVYFEEEQSNGSWTPMGSEDLGSVTIPANGSVTLSGTKTFPFAITETNVHTIRTTITVGGVYQEKTIAVSGAL